MRHAPLVLSVLLLAAPASAQEAETEEEAAQDAPRPGADLYTQRVQQGVQQLVSGDAPSAIEAFRQAVELDGARPQAPYYLASAQRLGGDLEQALAGFRQAAELARAASQPRWHTRALQAVAMTLERMEGRIEEARAAWQAYVELADANQTVSHPQLGRARIQAIDMMNEQEQVYVGVRERIAERERERAEQSDEDQGRRGRRRRRR